MSGEQHLSHGEATDDRVDADADADADAGTVDVDVDPDDTVKLEMRTDRRTRKRFKRLCADIDADASYEEVIEHIISRHEANPEFLKKHYR